MRTEAKNILKAITEGACVSCEFVTKLAKVTNAGFMLSYTRFLTLF